MKALEGEELYESYKKTRMYTDLPVCLKQPTQFVLKILGEYRKAHAVGTMKSGGLTVREYWDYIAGWLLTGILKVVAAICLNYSIRYESQR